MNTLKISLSTTYDVAPSHLKVECLGEVIHEGDFTEKNLLIEHTYHSDQFDIRIKKTGKDKKISDMNGTQEVIVESINLNGIDLKIKEFGMFKLGVNSWTCRYEGFMREDTLQTNELNLNGEWTLSLPKRNLVGEIRTKVMGGLRDQFSDCEIACFGCSQTYGAFLGNDQTWPSELERLTGKLVKNYGVSGSNINEITAMVEAYLENFKTDIILLYLPHTFRRQVREGDKILNLDGHDNFRNKDLVLHGEEHSIAFLSGSLMAWLENISKHTKIYFGTYQTDEYKLYQQTPLKKFMFPFLEGIDYPRASDGVHHGPEFNRDLAKILKDFLHTD